MSRRLVLLALAGAVLASLVMAARLWLVSPSLSGDALVDIVLFAIPGAVAGIALHLLLGPRRSP